MHLALRHFALRRHGVFLGAFDARGAASLQLGGTKAGHDGELECVHVTRTSDHDASSPADGFGEGSGRNGQRAQKSRDRTIYAVFVTCGSGGAGPAARAVR